MALFFFLFLSLSILLPQADGRNHNLPGMQYSSTKSHYLKSILVLKFYLLKFVIEYHYLICFHHLLHCHLVHIYMQPTIDDDFDCVDIYKQPAFQHPFLKNHKIQVMICSLVCCKASYLYCYMRLFRQLN